MVSVVRQTNTAEHVECLTTLHPAPIIDPREQRTSTNVRATDERLSRYTWPLCIPSWSYPPPVIKGCGLACVYMYYSQSCVRGHKVLYSVVMSLLCRSCRLFSDGSSEAAGCYVFACRHSNLCLMSRRRSTYNHLSSWLTDARNLTNPNTVSTQSGHMVRQVSKSLDLLANSLGTVKTNMF